MLQCDKSFLRVYCDKNEKVAHDPPRRPCGSLMFLPHYDVYRVPITEQTTAKCLSVCFIIKKSIIVPRIDFRTTVDVIS